MTDAYITRGARHSDLDVLAPMLSLAFAEPAIAIFPRGHTADSIAYRRAELEHWFLECTTELGVDEHGRPNAGTVAGQRRLMVVCPREGSARDVPIGFCQYEMVEPGMKHAERSATPTLPPMPPFPEGGDKEQYYLWKDMIWHTRRVVLGHCRHANVITMVVDSSYRGKGNYTRRAISDYCAQHYLAWGDIPNYNDAYPRAAPLWLRSGYKYVAEDVVLEGKTPYVFARRDRTEPTREMYHRRGWALPRDGSGSGSGSVQEYVTIPQIRWKVADRDVQDRMAPKARAAKEQQQAAKRGEESDKPRARL